MSQLFLERHVIDLHPWEYSEVPVMLGAAFGLDVPIWRCTGPAHRWR